MPSFASLHRHIWLHAMAPDKRLAPFGTNHLAHLSWVISDNVMMKADHVISNRRDTRRQIIHLFRRHAICLCGLITITTMLCHDISSFIDLALVNKCYHSMISAYRVIRYNHSRCNEAYKQGQNVAETYFYLWSWICRPSPCRRACTSRLADHGTTRNPEKLRDYSDKGWTILPFEDGKPIENLSRYLDDATHVITTISALVGHDPVMNVHRDEMSKFKGWSGYVSATSIYPDQEADLLMRHHTSTSDQKRP